MRSIKPGIWIGWLGLLTLWAIGFLQGVCTRGWQFRWLAGLVVLVIQGFVLAWLLTLKEPEDDVEEWTPPPSAELNPWSREEN